MCLNHAKNTKFAHNIFATVYAFFSNKTKKNLRTIILIVLKITKINIMIKFNTHL